MSTINVFLWSILSAISGTGVFFICQTLILIAYVIILILNKRNRAKRFKIVARFCIFCLGVLVIECSILVCIRARIEFLFCSLGSIFILLSTLVFPFEKNLVKDEHKKFIKFIDDEIKKDRENLPEKTVDQTNTIKPVQVKNDIPLGIDLDFEHVKNVISRLNYYPLTQNDKRQIAQLEAVLVSAERNENVEQIKSKISDGLSSLLKIMSKYGA